MMSALIELLTNRIFLSGIIAWICSQLIKAIIISIKRRKIDIAAIWELAGMPSTNTAILSAVGAQIYLTEGVTTAFLVVLAVFVWVLQEVLLARSAVDNYAEAVNSILKHLGKKYVPLKRRWGHTPLEVVAGLVFGIIIAFLVNLI